MINLSYKISIERERRARYRNPPIFAAISYTVSKESLDSLYHQSINKAIDSQHRHQNLSFEEGKHTLASTLISTRNNIFFHPEEQKISKFVATLISLIFEFSNESILDAIELKSGSKACGEMYQGMYFHTGIRLAVAVGPGGRCAVPGLHFQRVRSLLLSIEHHLREDLPGLPIDLEVILPLVSVAVHHVISDLKRKPDFPLL